MSTSKVKTNSQDNAPRFRSADEEFDENGMPIYHDSLIGTAKSLWAHIGRYKKDTFLTWLFVALETLGEILIPYIMQYLVDEIDVASTETINIGMCFLWGGIMLLLAVFGVIMGILAGFFAASSSAGLGANLRQAMFYKIQDYSFTNIDKFSTSSIVTRTTLDVSNVQFAFQQVVRSLLRAPMLMIFAMIMAFVTEWRLAFIFVAVIPVIGAALLFIAHFVHPLFVKIFRTYDDLNEDVQENIAGIRAVKAFGRQEEQKKRFGDTSEVIFDKFVRVEKILAFNSPLMQIASYIAILLLCYFGAQLITSYTIVGDKLLFEMSVGELSSLLSYVMQILIALMLITMIYTMVVMSRNSAERIIHIIEEVPDIVSPENGIKEVKNGQVDFNHVRFHFKDNPENDVLKDIDLHFYSGETIGIVGSTGSSKSTLLSMLARLYDVTDGSVMVGGEDVRNYDLHALREAVAVVLQKNTLFKGTIAENLRWGNESATDEQLKEACDIAQASSFIEGFPDKYETMIVQGGTNVSGGQKQRLCIARALLKSPKILILDDSTSAVDTHTDSLIRKGLFTKFPGTTKFIVAERVLSVKDCDTILVMDDGKVIAQGTNDELMEKCPMYKELYESQLGGGDFDVQAD